MKRDTRRTQRLNQYFIGLTLDLGGAAGARQAQRSGYGVSLHTLLRALAKVPLPLPTHPHYIGVDDFAFRKGKRYGTVIIDHERQQPIALLNDRKAQTLADWLKDYPEIQLVTRDRSQTYRAGINQGAPQAIQVADRFHLLQNLAQTLEAVFKAHPNDIKTADHQTWSRRYTPTALRHNPRKRQQRLARFQAVQQLKQKGQSLATIAQLTGLSVRTVRRFLKHPQFPERKVRSDQGGSPQLQPFQALLEKSCQQGERNGRQLFRQLQQHGYQGSYRTIARFLQRLQQTSQTPPERISKPRRRVVKRAKLTPRQAAFLVLKQTDKLSLRQQQQLAQLRQQPHFSLALQLAQDFITIVRKRQAERFDGWLQQVEDARIKPLIAFAKSLKGDYDALLAALSTSFSNGPTEGHINKLKMIKRQMFGRASPELLTKRFLLAS
ncbi:ISL3 family transposase [Sphaerothrix gracilis]|uniref:ISL3 family transposase n=1 Tax=Sphaerothrix gracilis TaxID=3151835 RepID=UPI0031FDE655